MTDPELDALVKAACSADGGCSYCAAQVLVTFLKACPGDNLLSRLEAAAGRLPKLGDNLEFAEPEAVMASVKRIMA